MYTISGFVLHCLWAAQVELVEESACQCRKHKRCRVNPWVGKIPWKSIWQPTPLFLPGESHGQRSMEGYSPQGRKDSGMTKVN